MFVGIRIFLACLVLVLNIQCEVIAQGQIFNTLLGNTNQMPQASMSTPKANNNTIAPTGVKQLSNSINKTSNTRLTPFDKDLDYRQNRQINHNRTSQADPLMFGERLFLGNFANKQFTGFNPYYKISISDQLDLKLWGAFEFQSTLIVDPQGFVFIPKVGPVKVQGLLNKDLNNVITAKIQSVFKSNVGVYCSLITTHPVKVFVTGFVQQPGLYEGFSSDSLLSYLDQAGGIDIKRGSFIDIELYRGSQLDSSISLYDFLLDGELDLLQFHDGDRIVVKPRHSTVTVRGHANNIYKFEFFNDYIVGDELMELAQPMAKANFVRINRLSQNTNKSYYVSLEDFKNEEVYPDDIVEFITDKLTDTITVSVLGEHNGSKRYILPYNASLEYLITQLKLNKRSNIQAVQLYRESLAQRQLALHDIALDNLERKYLTASSVSPSESIMRQQEAKQIEKFIKSARDIEPRGQVILAGAQSNYDQVYLEEDDEIFIPSYNALISINGEVLYPNTVAYKGAGAKYYIAKAGGFTDNADKKKIMIIHQDGSVSQASSNGRVQQGDEIIVMPKVKLKWFPLAKDIADIVFKSALIGRVFVDF